MKAGSQSGQAGSRASVQPCSRSRRAGSRAETTGGPAAATKDLGERAQTAQLGEKTLGEINTW